MTSIIYNPQLAEVVYSELEHKEINHPVISDFLYLIKTLSLETWDDKENIQDVEKIILDLSKVGKITPIGTNTLIKILDNLKIRISSNLPFKHSKSNIKSRVQHIDYY